MSRRRKLVIVGAGGLGVEAIWVARAMTAAGGDGWDILGFADDAPEKIGGEHYGAPILCASAEIPRVCGADAHVYVAVGDNQKRRRLAQACAEMGLRAATLVHPKAELAHDVLLGEGSYVGPFATLAPHCRVGRHVIVNIRAVVGHEARVGDFAQLAPGAVITGGCAVGVGAFVGANASLFPRRRVGDFASVASNSFVVADVPEGETAMGVPARAVFRKR